MRVKAKSLIFLLLIFSFMGRSQAETDLKTVFGLRDKNQLETLVQTTEKENPSDTAHLKLLGIAYHNLGVLEVKGAPGKAVQYLERAHQLSPNDSEILVYLGSAHTEEARDSWNVVTKVSRANRGIQMIDKAVKEAPNNPVVRMVRGNNSLKLPKFFNRRGVAKQDFLHLEQFLQKMPSSGVDRDTQAEIFYHLGELYEAEENKPLAKAYFEKAVGTSPDSTWGIEAKRHL